MLIGSNVPEAIRHNIWNGDFINLGLLLPKNLTSVTETNTNSLSIVGGSLVVQPKPASKIMDIITWTDAFIICISIFTVTHPEHIAGLLKYMHSVRLGARRHGGLGWRSFDEPFRSKKALTQESPWGMVDQELWVLFMLYPGQTSGNNPSPQTNLKCYEFN